MFSLTKGEGVIRYLIALAVVACVAPLADAARWRTGGNCANGQCSLQQAVKYVAQPVVKAPQVVVQAVTAPAARIERAPVYERLERRSWAPVCVFPSKCRL